MRTARPAISGNQLASTGKFECGNFSNFRLCHAIFPICSISSNIISSKTVLEYILVLLIRKTAALSKCNGVFFSVKIGTVELRKSNILAPKHGGDGVILASVIWLACSVHIVQVSGWHTSHKRACHDHVTTFPSRSFVTVRFWILGEPFDQ